MNHRKSKKWTSFDSNRFKTFGFASVLLAGFMSYTTTWGESSNRVSEKVVHAHEIVFPSVMPEASKNNCTVEAAAYAAAIAHLNQAQAIANAAHHAWYECEYGGSQNATDYAVEIPSAEYSVLVKD